MDGETRWTADTETRWTADTETGWTADTARLVTLDSEGYQGKAVEELGSVLPVVDQFETYGRSGLQSMPNL